MNIHLVEQHAYALLEKLPEFLYYHNKKHTGDVVSAAVHLSQQEGIIDEETCFVQAAALLHDTGFLHAVTGFNHEKESCRIAEQILPSAGFNESGIATVQNLILSTTLPQSPETHLEKILCDADLFYLGTEEFFSTSHLLYLELTALQKINSEKEWYHLQVQFLSSHHYFTRTAHEQLEPQKQAHLQSVIKKRATLL